MKEVAPRVAKFQLSPEATRHFRDDFRAARATIGRDAEAFDAVLFALERFGATIAPGLDGLSRYRPWIAKTLFDGDPPEDFVRLYEVVRQERNGAMHQGFAARHLAQNCAKLALMMEDRLSESFTVVSDLMVSHPVLAELWQPLSLIRGAMLTRSFSYLPFVKGGEVYLLRDADLMLFLRGGNRKKRLAVTLEDALSDGLNVARARCVRADNTILEALTTMTDAAPAVVQERGRIVGILTAFDLL